MAVSPGFAEMAWLSFERPESLPSGCMLLVQRSRRSRVLLRKRGVTLGYTAAACDRSWKDSQWQEVLFLLHTLHVGFLLVHLVTYSPATSLSVPVFLPRCKAADIDVTEHLKPHVVLYSAALPSALAKRLPLCANGTTERGRNMVLLPPRNSCGRRGLM